MYTPKHFSLHDDPQIASLIAACPLALIVAATGQGLLANHIPLLADGDGFIGHVALANPMHEAIAADSPVLAVFTAGDGYVSPNWYPSKAQTHRAVPTWNYRVVHVHGTLNFSHEDAEKRRVVSRLTTVFERRTNGAEGWRMGDAPADFIAAQLAGIVALRLRVSRVEAKAKLSQNRAPADVDSVAREFETRGNQALAQAMRRRD